MMKVFDDCSYKGNLRFDFHIPSLNLCIEYDGIQHYKPIDFGGKGVEFAEKSFMETKEKDEIKTLYCKDNNIDLLRIPYFEFINIKEILKKELNV